MAVRATSPVSTVLCDDEAPALDELQFLLRDFPGFQVIGTARNGLEAVKVIEQTEPDLVFLDVQMPGLDGLGVIRRLKEDRAPMPEIVLCTAYDQYAVEAFRLEALDYLLKPVERERLAQTLDRVKRTVAEAEAPVSPVAAPAAGYAAKLLVRTAGRHVIIDPADLVYATIDDGQITVVATQCEGLSSYKTIEELQSALDPAVFWRVHRSYLVNMNRIREVIPWFKSSFQLKMDDRNQTEIPVSRVQTKRLRELLNL